MKNLISVPAEDTWKPYTSRFISAHCERHTKGASRRSEPTNKAVFYDRIPLFESPSGLLKKGRIALDVSRVFSHGR